MTKLAKFGDVKSSNISKSEFSTKPKPQRLTAEEQKVADARFDRESRRLEAQRKRERDRAEAAVAFLRERLGSDFAVLRTMLEGTTAHELRAVILSAS